MYILQNDHHNTSTSYPSPHIVTKFFSYDENFYDLLFLVAFKCVLLYY